MRQLTRQAREYFKLCGKNGGNKRKKRLSAARRAEIAKLAAQSRWSDRGKVNKESGSIRLASPEWSEPVYIEEILSEGGIKEWAILYNLISEHPFGKIAKSLERVVSSTHIYGATNLWRSLLVGLRGMV